MTTKEVIRDVIDFAHRVTHGYLSDFADGDLLVRPLPEMNHTAWQIGHLICSEHSMMTRIGITMPDLPPGFADNYTDQTSRSDDRQLFATKAEYFTLWDASRPAHARTEFLLARQTKSVTKRATNATNAIAPLIAMTRFSATAPRPAMRPAHARTEFLLARGRRATMRSTDAEARYTGRMCSTGEFGAPI